MPRAFSEIDRDRIHRRLLEAAREHFARFGFRRASIAEITRGAGIAKGSLYLFFPSKVALFLAVAREVEGAVRTRLIGEMERPGSRRERIERFLRFQFDALEDDPILRVLSDPQEAEVLFREIPPDELAAARADDDAFFAALIEARMGGEEPPIDPGAVAALPRAFYAVRLQRELIGDSYPRVVELLIESLALRLAPEEGP